MIDVDKEQPMMDSSTPEQMVLGYIKRVAQVSLWGGGRKPVSSVPPWPLLLFLPLGSCLEFFFYLPFTME